MKREVVFYVAFWLLPSFSLDASSPVDAYGRVLYDEAGRAVFYPADDRGRFSSEGDDEAGRTSREVGESSSGAGPSESAYALTPWINFANNSRGDSAAIGDVTGDQRPDVVITTTYRPGSEDNYKVFVYPQQANGTLGQPTSYPYVSWADRSGLVLADLNQDGVKDVVVGHRTGITTLLADGSGGLLPGTVVEGTHAETLSAVDIQPDGHVDIISLSRDDGATLFFGDGTGGFGTIEPLAASYGARNDHEVADLNNDQMPDVALSNGSNASIALTVHLNNGAGGFAANPSVYPTPESPSGIGLGDVTGDGLVDAVLSRGNNSPTNIWVFAQLLGGGLDEPLPISSYDIPQSVEVADLDRDGRRDVAVVHGGWERLGIYLQQAAGGLGTEQLFEIPYASHYAPQGLALGDISSDGCTDVVIADYGSGLVILYGVNCVSRLLHDGFEEN